VADEWKEMVRKYSFDNPLNYGGLVAQGILIVITFLMINRL
jgi:hypothetical protein